MDFEKIPSARRPPIPIGKKVPKISKDLKEDPIFKQEVENLEKEIRNV